MRVEVMASILVKITAIWDVTSHSSKNSCKSFDEIFCISFRVEDKGRKLVAHVGAFLLIHTASRRT
jgi:hypothetical protein